MDKYLIKSDENNALPDIIEVDEGVEEGLIYIESSSDDEWIEKTLPSAVAADTASTVSTNGPWRTWGFYVQATKEMENRLKKTNCNRLQVYKTWGGECHMLKGTVTFRISVSQKQALKVFNSDVSAAVWPAMAEEEFNKEWQGELIMYIDKRSRLGRKSMKHKDIKKGDDQRMEEDEKEIA